MRRPENLKLKYFLEKLMLCAVWKLFSYVFLWRWKSKVSFVLKFERCVCEVFIAFCIERPSEEGAPLGGGIKLCGSSSCVWGFRCLLNTEGILTLWVFLFGDGSLIWMWSASFTQWCRVLLSLSIIVKSLISTFWCLWRCGGFWWYWWLDFYGLKFFVWGTCWFHLCIQLCSCQLGISSGRLYQFSVYLDLDLFWCMSKDLMVLVSLRKTVCILLECVCTVHWGLWNMVWQL